MSAMPNAGDPAPDAELPDQNGQTVRLADLRGKWVVLYFYPKDNTSGCTAEACGFRDAWGELERLGAVVLGVSPDSSKSHRGFADRYGLPFRLLADQGAQLAQRYGVWVEKSMYGRRYMGTARTTFAIDPRGRIARVWERVKPPGHAAEVLEWLRGSAEGGSAARPFAGAGGA